MPTYILGDGSQVMCSHAATASITTSNRRVKVNGEYATTLSDLFTVSGCPFQVPIGTGTKPQPCIKIQWIKPALRVKVNGQPVLLQDSSGLCQSAEQIPQGAPQVVVTQIRVKGT